MESYEKLKAKLYEKNLILEKEMEKCQKDFKELKNGKEKEVV